MKIKKYCQIISLLYLFGIYQIEAQSLFEERALFVNGVGGYECYRIPAIVSAKDGTNLNDLMQQIAQKIPEPKKSDEENLQALIILI